MRHLQKLLQLLKPLASCYCLLESEIITCMGTGEHGVLFLKKPSEYLVSQHCPFKRKAKVVA